MHRSATCRLHKGGGGVTREVVLAAPVGEVWDALTNPERFAGKGLRGASRRERLRALGESSGG